MKIIGITGKIGAGKDAVAAAMIAADSNVRRIALADALKRTTLDLFDLSFEQVYGSQAQKIEVDPRWDKSPREILQTLGTEVGRALHPDVWVRRMLRDMTLWEEERQVPKARSQCSPIWVVPDVRFPNEAAAVREAGGVILKVRRNFRSRKAETCSECSAVWRPDFHGAQNLDLDAAAWHNPGCPHAHASEAAIERVIPDYTFLNDVEGLESVSYWAKHYLERAKAERGWI